MNDQKAVIVDESEAREMLDTLENLIASLGTENDKRAHSRFTNSNPLTFDYEQLNAMYRTDWITGKAVDIIPNDMTREWRSFKGDNLDPEIIRKLQKEEKRLKLRFAFNEGHKWGRLYGGGLIVISVDDGNLPSEPLEIDRIKPRGLRHIKVVDRHQCAVVDQVTENPLSSNYGYPEFYQLNTAGVRIHHSRVLRFDGIVLPFREMQRNQYWHESIVPRLYDTMVNFWTANNGSASMIYESNVDIIKVKGLMNYLQTQQGTELLRKRFGLSKLLKSFNNTQLLDSEEEWQNKTNAFSGLPQLMDFYSKVLASACDIPGTRFLGDSPGGLNSNGNGELHNYYDNMASRQEIEYSPKLDYFDQIMMKSLGIEIGEDDLEYEWNPLYQMSDQERSAMEYQDAQRDQIYWNMNVLTEDIIVKELKQKGVYSNISDEYVEEMVEALKEIEEEEENGQANAFTTENPIGTEEEGEGNPEDSGSSERD